jgi:hypothetical protein
MDPIFKEKLCAILEDIRSCSLEVVNTEADQEYILSRIEMLADKALGMLFDSE